METGAEQITAEKEISKNAEESRKALAAKELAREVKLLREQARWTQAELAEKLRVSQSVISDMELGRYNFPLDSIVRLARAFGKSPYEFFAIYLGDSPERFTIPEKELLTNIIELVANYLNSTASAGLETPAVQPPPPPANPDFKPSAHLEAQQASATQAYIESERLKRDQEKANPKPTTFKKSGDEKKEKK